MDEQAAIYRVHEIRERPTNVYAEDSSAHVAKITGIVAPSIRFGLAWLFVCVAKGWPEMKCSSSLPGNKR